VGFLEKMWCNWGALRRISISHPSAQLKNLEWDLKSTLKDLPDLSKALFTDINRLDRRLRWAWLAVLFLIGVGVWTFFFNWSRMDFAFHDWTDITAPRLMVWHDAILKGALPLHVSDPGALNFFNDRFMSVPDILLSPQVILLRWLNYGQFVVVDVLLLYALGYWGLVRLAKKQHLSLLAFTVLFLLYHFNGQMLAHLGVGHLTWTGSFLLSWFVLLVFELLDRPERGFRMWRWAACMALLLLGMYLQGAFHQFIYCLLFLGLLALTRRKFFVPALAAAGLAVLVSMVRILPPVASLGSMENAYLGGYVDLLDIWRGLVVVPTPDLRVPFTDSWLGAWETTFYVGILGGLFLLYFGVYRWVKRVAAMSRDAADARPEDARLLDGRAVDERPLLLPVLVLTVLSTGLIFGEVRHVLPILSSERVSSRLFSLPFLFLVVLSVGEFQRWLEANGPRRLEPQLGLLLLVVAEFVDLGRMLKIWSVQNVAVWFPKEEGLTRPIFMANHADPLYLNFLWAGLALTLLTLAGMGALVWAERGKGDHEKHETREQKDQSRG
jgi:hypothetical protein